RADYLSSTPRSGRAGGNWTVTPISSEADFSDPEAAIAGLERALRAIRGEAPFEDDFSILVADFHEPAAPYYAIGTTPPLSVPRAGEPSPGR
ncbi:MAG: hypothetical protein MI919_37300, partial [Holophagales bacterium]|nr:hypothetical protein [Holophagales bacterium]